MIVLMSSWILLIQQKFYRQANKYHHFCQQIVKYGSFWKMAHLAIYGTHEIATLNYTMHAQYNVYAPYQ